jgi:carbamoyl-phosphate synthase large subunit
MYDNRITVCNMENLDPSAFIPVRASLLHLHRRSQTRYHTLRKLSIKIIRHIGIIGECKSSTQSTLTMKITGLLKLTPVSPPSALASKATGYPLAFVAAKLALGYGLTK